MAYLRHLFLAREAAVVVLATVHNLHFYLGLLRRLRWAIITGRFPEIRRAALGEPGCGKARRSAKVQQGNALFQLLPFIIIFVIFYLLLFLPMRRRQKKHQEMLSKLTKATGSSRRAGSSAPCSRSTTTS